MSDGEAIEGEGVIKREALAELLPSGDGRTLEVRIVPYNKVSRVSDDGGQTFYDEEWLPGVFDKQMSAANRVYVNFEHQRGIQGTIGRGHELRDQPDGLEGTFRMLDHPDADKALQLVHEGALHGVSLEAKPTKSERVNGVVRRVKAQLVNIALCRSPAFAGAEVLAVREQQDGTQPVESDEAQVPKVEDMPQPAPDPNAPDVENPAPAVERSALDELLARVGYEPLAKRAVTRAPWNGAASKYADADAYCKACLIDMNPAGEDKVMGRCMLPVYEPNGDLNANALSAAAGRLNQTGAPAADKAAAARKLMRLYGMAGMQPPPSLRGMASS